MPTSPAHESLARRAYAGDVEARNELACQYQRLAAHVARRACRSRRDLLADCEQEAMIGILKGAERWSPDRPGVDLCTYLAYGASNVGVRYVWHQRGRSSRVEPESLDTLLSDRQGRQSDQYHPAALTSEQDHSARGIADARRLLIEAITEIAAARSPQSASRAVPLMLEHHLEGVPIEAIARREGLSRERLYQLERPILAALKHHPKAIEAAACVAA